MKKLSRLLLMLGCAAIAVPAGAQRNIAYQDAQVRISLVTDGVARLEYAPEGRFLDGNSLVAVNRNYPQVDYQVAQRGKQVEIKTPRW